eukprot:gene20291-22277_t
MAKIEDLKSVLKETLENRGVLSNVRARIRAEVFNALDDHNEPKPALSNENLLINELIREYLEFNNYSYTNSVLLAEANQPKEKIDRKFLQQELNVKDEVDNINNIPLLYGIISHFLQGKNIQSQISKPLSSYKAKEGETEYSSEEVEERQGKNRLIIYGNRP